MKYRTWTLGALALGVTALGSAAISAPGAEAQAPARVRVVHMSPDAPAVDVLVDGQKAIDDLAFKSATEYAALPAGRRDVQVTPANQNETAVIAAMLPLQAGQDQTVVAVGRVAEIGALPLQDDNQPPAAGKAKVRFVHASPDAPAVDVAVAGGPVLFSNVAFRGVAGYSEVDAGAYTLEVRAAGTNDVALGVPNVVLQPGQIVTIFAAGLAGDNTLSAVPVAYPAAQAASLPRAGTGGALQADSTLNRWLIAGLALAAAVVIGSAGTVAAARRRGR
jgi:hypothetical protein